MFTYQHRDLYIESVSLRKIAEEIGTPFYAYSMKTLIERATEYSIACNMFDNSLICYAMKANNHPAILSLFAKMGLGADVVSGYELTYAIKCGIPPEKIVFSGVGKTADEIKLAIDYNIKQINVESLAELQAIQIIASAAKKRVPIAIRVNPNVDANTHAKITTGKSDNKFGITISDLKSVVDLVQSSSHIHWQGIAVHIGSQILELRPYYLAYSFVMELVRELATFGIIIDHLDFGGGIGIAYQNAPNFTINDYTAMVLQVINNWQGTIIFEPGRFLVGESGALVTEVIYTKQSPNKNFAIVNAAMTDLIRPALYDAVHRIVPVHLVETSHNTMYDVVGPVCETGDILGRDVLLPRLNSGNLLAILDAGAYGAALSSNYNMRSLPAEVMVDDDEYCVITQRQSLDDLNRNRRPWIR